MQSCLQNLSPVLKSSKMQSLAFAILLATFTTAREHPNVENYGTDLPRGFRKPILGGGDTGKDEIYMIGDVSDNEVGEPVNYIFLIISH